MASPVEELKYEKSQLLKKYIEEYLNGNETLFHENQDAIMFIDLNGQIVKVNQAFINLSKYNSKEVLQLKLQSLFPLECLERVYHYFYKASLGQFQNFDCFMRDRNGQMIDLNIMNIPISVENEIIGIFSVAKDITELKRKKAEVRKIENYHCIFTENVSDIILSTNFIGNILYTSPSCKSILGFTPEELNGQHISMLLHREDKEKFFSDREHLLTRLESTRGSYRFLKKDGNYIWMESLCKPIMDDGNITEVVSVIRDITERVKVEEELWNGRNAFFSLIEHSPDAVIIAKDFEIIFINETGVNLVGAAKREDIISKSLFDFIHPDYLPLAEKRLKEIINGGPSEFAFYKLVLLDGTIMEAEIKAIPIHFQEKTALHIIVRDITEKKKTQQLILNSEKLSLAGRLAAGIAHEVRNPLTAIKGFLKLLGAELNNHAYLEIIKSEMDRIESILTELLVLAKPQDLKLEKENISTLIEEVKTLIDTQAILNSIEIEIVNDDPNLTILCDKSQLKQVFINFLKNAIEAMREGGTVTIEVKRSDVHKVSILIKDIGVGIPQHILKRIGEPFFTTKENGTGLGIMISKQIIENHNGSVHFYSNENGTIIEVRLPVTEGF